MKAENNKLAETYFHFKTEVSPQKLQAIEEYLFEYANSLSKDLFKGNTFINVSIEEGSLKGWVTVAGIMYGVVVGYGSFRSGIDHIVKDAKHFSENTISHLTKKEGISQTEIIRTERRLGIPGKIQRVFKKIDKIKIINKGDKVILNIEEVIKHDLKRIFEQIAKQKDRDLLFSNLPEMYRESLHLNLINPKIKINHTYGELIKIIKGETPPLEDDYKWFSPNISKIKKEEDNYDNVVTHKLLEDSINDDNKRLLLPALQKNIMLE